MALPQPTQPPAEPERESVSLTSFARTVNPPDPEAPSGPVKALERTPAYEM